jgi:geranylgeranyl diphosphate synthase type I
MDADELRRGRPTVWARFGTPFAILLGDALLALASQVLTQEGGGHDAARLCAELSEMTVTLCRGQLQDMAFEVLPVVSVEDYLEMAAGKTAALLSGACVLGGMAGGGSETQVKALRGFGYHLGLAFQLVDDVLGIWGEPAVTGKPAGADLLRYKKSMPVLCALSSTSKAEDELAELYRQRAIAGPRELALAVKLVECAGGRERTEAEAAKQLQLALRCIDDLSGDPLALHDLKELAALMVDRNR